MLDAWHYRRLSCGITACCYHPLRLCRRSVTVEYHKLDPQTWPKLPGAGYLVKNLRPPLFKSRAHYRGTMVQSLPLPLHRISSTIIYVPMLYVRNLHAFFCDLLNILHVLNVYLIYNIIWWEHLHYIAYLRSKPAVQFYIEHCTHFANSLRHLTLNVNGRCLMWLGKLV